jgi:hypothetical protein
MGAHRIGAASHSNHSYVALYRNNQNIEASPFHLESPAEKELAPSILNPASPDPNKYLIPNLKFRFKFKSNESVKEREGS